MLALSQQLRCARAVNRVNCVTSPSQRNSCVGSSGIQHNGVANAVQMPALSATIRYGAPSRTCIIARSSVFNRFSSQAIRVVVLAQQEAKVQGFIGAQGPP
jgi:hypothetical protein